MVGGGDNAFLFHFVNQRSRTIVADAKLALNIAGGGFFVVLDDGDGLSVQIFVGTGGKIALVEDGAAVFFGKFAFGNAGNIFRFALDFQKFDDFFNFAVFNERAVDANRTLSGRHIKHIAHAEQLFGTLFAQMVRLSILEVT